MIDPRDLKPQMWKVLQFLLPFLVVALVWEAAAQLAASNQFPPVSELLGKLYDLAFDRGVLVDHFLSSMYRLILGYLLAIAAGVTLGMLMGISRNLSEAFSPALSLLISIPTIAWVPILLITLGLGGETVIAAVFLGGFFAITYSMMHGIRMVDRNLVNSART
ncbi:MAG: ABC transporter permease, partial [Thermoplasmatota archaeon]